MSDEETGHSTRRISSDQMDELRDMLETSHTEVSITITPEVLARVDALLPQIQETDDAAEDLKFAVAVRQIFMAGLYALEKEFD